MARHVPLVLSIGVSLLVGCAAQAPAPIEGKTLPSSRTVRAPRPPLVRAPKPPPSSADTHRVVRGDTLYSIAFRYGLDPGQLAQMNGLDNPNRILVGQHLRLKPRQASATTTASAPSPSPPRDHPHATASSPSREPSAAVSTDTPASAPSPAVVATAPMPDAVTGGSRDVSGVAWTWPASGKTRRAIAASGSEGLEILGERGQPVLAAAAGQVVYSGNGLRGYGQLIIIKHNDIFLSAYAHNDKLLVTEGTRVNAGQQIALMGDSEASEVMLHFEIRKSGKAVGPLQFLPQR